MNYTYAYLSTINAITLELNFFADMNIKLFTTSPKKSLTSRSSCDLRLNKEVFQILRSFLSVPTSSANKNLPVYLKDCSFDGFLW